MKKNLVEMVFVLDRSGSMSGLEGDTIGGFNSMVDKQKAVEGDALVTTVLFDNEHEYLMDGINIKSVNHITDKEYYVRGCTALMDALGNSINKIGAKIAKQREADRPEKVMFIIITDGMENASHDYNIGQIKEMIEHQKAKYNWEFMFLGANIDAVGVAAQYGIDANMAVEYCCDSEGTQINFEAVSQAIQCVRENESMASVSCGEWQAPIIAHRKAQAKK